MPRVVGRALVVALTAAVLLAASPAAAQHRASSFDDAPALVSIDIDHQLILTGLGLLSWGAVVFAGGGHLIWHGSGPESIAGYAMVGFGALTMAVGIFVEREALRTALPPDQLRARAEGTGSLRLANALFAGFAGTATGIGTAIGMLDDLRPGEWIPWVIPLAAATLFHFLAAVLPSPAVADWSRVRF